MRIGLLWPWTSCGALFEAIADTVSRAHAAGVHPQSLLPASTHIPRQVMPREPPGCRRIRAPLPGGPTARALVSIRLAPTLLPPPAPPDGRKHAWRAGPRRRRTAPASGRALRIEGLEVNRAPTRRCAPSLAVLSPRRRPRLYDLEGPPAAGTRRPASLAPTSAGVAAQLAACAMLRASAVDAQRSVSTGYLTERSPRCAIAVARSASPAPHLLGVAGLEGESISSPRRRRR